MSKICRDISALLSNAQVACNTFLAECKSAGLNVKITETYRSQARQNELYAQGRTTSGNIVTWTKNSRHTSRLAWDICQNIKGKEYDTSTGFFDKCGKIATSLGITWGGSWKTPDRPHFEVSADWTLSEDYINKEKKMQETEALKTRVAALEEAAVVYNTIDSTMPEWIKNITEWALEKGIIQGTGNGLGMTKTKAEALVMLKNALQLIG